MRSCHADSHYTKIVAFPTGTVSGVPSHLPDYLLGPGQERINHNKITERWQIKTRSKGEEGSQEDERSGQREGEVQAGSPELAPQTQEGALAGAAWH